MIRSCPVTDWEGDTVEGTDFDKVRDSEVKAAETWLNNYPRGILGFRSAASAFSEAVGLAA